MINLFKIAVRIAEGASDECSTEAAITYKSAPEYKSVEDFAQYLMDDDRTQFSHEDLAALNYRLRMPVHMIKKELEAYGFTLAPRQSVAAES